jgi:hypothetical protein
MLGITYDVTKRPSVFFFQGQGTVNLWFYRSKLLWFYNDSSLNA